MVKQNCNNCWNRSGADYCTRHLDINAAKYKTCNGWTKIIMKESKVKINKEQLDEEKSERELRLLSKLDLGFPFEKFIVDGGFYSFRTKSYKVEN